MKTPMMKCGHAANAKNGKGEPVCGICFGTTKDAEEINTNPPDLTSRKARCKYCGHEEKSTANLPYFEFNKEQEKDRYYCGCMGWN